MQYIAGTVCKLQAFKEKKPGPTNLQCKSLILLMPHHGSIFDSPAPCIRYFITKPTQNLYPHLLPRWSSFEVSLSSAHPNPTITTDTAVLSRIASPTPSTSTSPSLHSFPLQLPSSKLGENEGSGDLGDLHQKLGNLRGKVAHLS